MNSKVMNSNEICKNSSIDHCYGVSTTVTICRFQSLQKLQVLDVSYNDFSKGLPDVISLLSSLRELNLNSCDLCTQAFPDR